MLPGGRIFVCSGVKTIRRLAGRPARRSEGARHSDAAQGPGPFHAASECRAPSVRQRGHSQLPRPAAPDV